MKRISQILTVLFSAAVFITSCKSPGASTTEELNKDTTAVAQKMDYPYTIDKPDNWETGSQQNTMNALKALKAWENKDIDESLKYFADSISVRFDGLEKTISNDSLKTFFDRGNAGTKSWRIKLEDWESVISKDKKDEYVTIWYRQYQEKTNGDKDSVDVINDIKMKDGKIIRLDEYTRRLH